MPSHAEPRWRPARHYLQIPLWQRDWLLDERSLTARLKTLSGGQFRVEVLRQQWQRAQPSEAQLLNIPWRSACLIREVILYGNNQPWIYARSVMPATSLTGHLYRLRRLKNTSLGELLFRDKNLSRSEFELCGFSARDPQLPAGLVNSGYLWSRRCRFELSGKSLLVSEVFLPALWQIIARQRA